MAEATATTEARGARKVREGVVASTAMDKTAVVTVITRKPHPRYKKTMARTTRLYVHDEENTTQRNTTPSAIARALKAKAKPDSSS